MSGLNNKQKEQSSVCNCASSDLLLKLLKQNSQLINQVTQLIQINNEQNAQINELLIQLEGDEDEKPKSGYLDG